MTLRSLLGGIIRNETPVPYVSKWRSGLGVGLGREAMDHTRELSQYEANGVLFGIVSKLAMTTSLVNWRLYQSSATGEDEDRTEIPGHPALKVWNKPNLFMGRQEFIETTQQHVDLTGEGWWVVVKLGTVPVEIWPVRPDRMHVVSSPTEFIRGYIYRGPDGEEVPLRREDVIMIRWPRPLDIYRGASPLPALAGDLGNEQSQVAWNTSFYRNSAQPGGVITVDRRMSDAEFEEMSIRWQTQHQGVSNAGRVAILEQAEFTPLVYSQRDMQYVETKGLTKQAMLDAYGFPKFGLGDVDDVNRATATASLDLIAQTLTIPRLERLKFAAGEFLAMFGATANGREFDYDNPISPDIEAENATLIAKTTALKTLTDAGFDSDEACDVVGLPRMTRKEPEPEIVKVPSSAGRELPAPDDYQVGELVMLAPGAAIEMAMRWEVIGHKDDNCCDPCKKNIGKLYRNRSSAYADYPGGKGYIKCIGAKYGNNCRCSVKRRRKSE